MCLGFAFDEKSHKDFSCQVDVQEPAIHRQDGQTPSNLRQSIRSTNLFGDRFISGNEGIFRHYYDQNQLQVIEEVETITSTQAGDPNNKYNQESQHGFDEFSPIKSVYLEDCVAEIHEDYKPSFLSEAAPLSSPINQNRIGNVWKSQSKQNQPALYSQMSNSSPPTSLKATYDFTRAQTSPRNTGPRDLLRSSKFQSLENVDDGSALTQINHKKEQLLRFLEERAEDQEVIGFVRYTLNFNLQIISDLLEERKKIFPKNPSLNFQG